MRSREGVSQSYCLFSTWIGFSYRPYIIRRRIGGSAPSAARSLSSTMSRLSGNEVLPGLLITLNALIWLVFFSATGQPFVMERYCNPRSGMGMGEQIGSYAVITHHGIAVQGITTDRLRSALFTSNTEHHSIAGAVGPFQIQKSVHRLETIKMYSKPQLAHSPGPPSHLSYIAIRPLI